MQIDEFQAIATLIDTSPIWEKIKTELELQIEKICGTKGTDIAGMKKKGKGEPDMAFLVKRIVDCSSVITTVYDVDEKYLKPKILKAYQKCVENKEAEFKFLLKLIFRIDPQKIENDMDKLLVGAGALDKLKQKSVWHVPPKQVEGRAHPDVTNRTKLN